MPSRTEIEEILKRDLESARLDHKLAKEDLRRFASEMASGLPQPDEAHVRKLTR
jgi:hypothetical protein